MRLLCVDVLVSGETFSLIALCVYQLSVRLCDLFVLSAVGTLDVSFFSIVG